MSTQRMVEEFKAGLHRSFDDARGHEYVVALFEKINDPLKLHQFLKDEHFGRFQDYYFAFLNEHRNPRTIATLMDDAIADIAEEWFKEEMLEWSYEEKLIFLNYVSKLKEFRVRQAVLFHQNQLPDHPEQVEWNKRKRDSDDDEGEEPPPSYKEPNIAKCA
jgi:hypothetical protein